MLSKIGLFLNPEYEWKAGFRTACPAAVRIVRPVLSESHRQIDDVGDVDRHEERSFYPVDAFLPECGVA